jgi:NitT/TauT family transport system substrate-binding protein
MKGWLAANRPAAQKVLQALMQAEQELESRPVEARKLVAARLKAPEAQLAAIMAQQRSAVSLDQILILSLEEQARWMMEFGLVEGTRAPNFLRFVDPTLLRELRPSAVTLK